MNDDTLCFATFVVGPSNQLTCSAAHAVASRPGAAYNPLFIHGGAGLGKTHLLRAIAHQVTRDRADARVVYVYAETIINEFISCVLQKRMPLFREKYRQCDVLLVDDVQNISQDHAKTQDELFHVFNVLHNARKQIVLSADVPPGELRGLEARLRSRFEWGLTVDVRPPDLAHRVAILRDKAARVGVVLTEDALRVVAERCNGNVRQLEGALTNLRARWELERAPLTLEAAAQLVAEHRPPARSEAETVRLVQKKVAAAFGSDVAALLGKSRGREVARARQVAMYLARRHAKASLAELGRRFGGRDHSTVLHGCQKIEAELRDDASLRALVETLERALA